MALIQSCVKTQTTEKMAASNVSRRQEQSGSQATKRLKWKSGYQWVFQNSGNRI